MMTRAQRIAMRVGVASVLVLITGFTWLFMNAAPPPSVKSNDIVHIEVSLEMRPVWVWNEDALGFDCVPFSEEADAAGVCDDYPLPLSPASLDDYDQSHRSP